MAGEVKLNGTVVEKRPVGPGDGLYLLTEDHQFLALIADIMAAQASREYLHEQSRQDFESYLGKKVTVEGYLSGTTLWGATIVD